MPRYKRLDLRYDNIHERLQRHRKRHPDKEGEISKRAKVKVEQDILNSLCTNYPYLGRLLLDIVRSDTLANAPQSIQKVINSIKRSKKLNNQEEAKQIFLRDLHDLEKRNVKLMDSLASEAITQKQKEHEDYEHTSHEIGNVTSSLRDALSSIIEKVEAR